MDAYASRNIGGLVPRGALSTMRDINPQVQVSADGGTVWVHGEDGSLRTIKKGEKAGQQFYGCAKFPGCRFVRAIEES